MIKIAFNFCNKTCSLNRTILRAYSSSPPQTKLEDNKSSLKSFDEIPGPKRYPFVGHLPQIKTFGGEFDVSDFSDFAQKLHSKYGDMVRWEMPGRKTVCCFFFSFFIKMIH
jgi:hypothetical protein